MINNDNNISYTATSKKKLSDMLENAHYFVRQVNAWASDRRELLYDAENLCHEMISQIDSCEKNNYDSFYLRKEEKELDAFLSIIRDCEFFDENISAFDETISDVENFMTEIVSELESEIEIFEERQEEEDKQHYEDLRHDLHKL